MAFEDFDRTNGGFTGAVAFTPGATPAMKTAIGGDNTIPWASGSPLTSMPAPMDFSGIQKPAPNIFEPPALQPVGPKQQSAQDILQGMSAIGEPRAPFAPVTPQPSAPMTLTPEQARQENIKQGIASGGTVPLPLDGVGSLDGLPPTDIGDQKAMTPEEIKIQNEFRKGQKEQQEATQLYRQARWDTRERESGAKSAKEKIARSLKEQGLTKEDIESDSRYKDAKTEQEKFKAVSAIQKRESLKRVRTAKDQRVASRISKKARRNEDGTPKNDAAVAEDYDAFFTEINPETGKPLAELMTPSQKREYERYNDKASRGNVNDSEAGRIERIKQSVTRKVEHAQEVAAVAERKRKMQEVIDNAQSKAEKSFYSGLESQIEGIEKRLDEGKFDDAGLFGGSKKKAALEVELRSLEDQWAAGHKPELKQESQSAKAGNVAMKSPDGRTLSVPADRVDEFITDGATRL